MIIWTYIIEIENIYSYLPNFINVIHIYQIIYCIFIKTFSSIQIPFQNNLYEYNINILWEKNFFIFLRWNLLFLFNWNEINRKYYIYKRENSKMKEWITKMEEWILIKFFIKFLDEKLLFLFLSLLRKMKIVVISIIWQIDFNMTH